MATTEELLKGISLFSDFDHQELAHLAQVAVPREYEPGSVIVNEGEAGVAFFIIESGEVDVVKALDSAKPITLATLGSGQYFGEMALLENYVRSTSVVAKKKTRCLALPEWEFTATVKTHPDMAFKMLTILSRRLRMTDQALKE